MKAKHDARLERLAHVELFAGCDHRQLVRIAALSNEITLPAGTVACREGTSAQEAFVLLDGNAVVSVGGQIIAVLRPGEVFGEVSLLESVPRVATVTAASDLSVLVLTRRELSAVLDEIPAVAARVRDIVRDHKALLEPPA